MRSGAHAASDGLPPGESAFFEGFGLDVRGTIAGLETYGVAPDARGPLREDVGRLAYMLVVEIDELLRRHDFDPAAKHWAIYAERGAQFTPRTVPAKARRGIQPPDVRTINGSGPWRTHAVRSDQPRASAKTRYWIEAPDAGRPPVREEQPTLPIWRQSIHGGCECGLRLCVRDRICRGQRAVGAENRQLDIAHRPI